jgi:hypothetical protein
MAFICSLVFAGSVGQTAVSHLKSAARASEFTSQCAARSQIPAFCVGFESLPARSGPGGDFLEHISRKRHASCKACICTVPGGRGDRF